MCLTKTRTGEAPVPRFERESPTWRTRLPRPRSTPSSAGLSITRARRASVREQPSWRHPVAATLVRVERVEACRLGLRKLLVADDFFHRERVRGIIDVTVKT